MILVKSVIHSIFYSLLIKSYKKYGKEFLHGA